MKLRLALRTTLGTLAAVACSREAEIAGPRCYVSGPILARLAPPGTQTTKRGWLRLEGSQVADSGTARFVESDGAVLAALWTRHGDTLRLHGADDFIRLSAAVVEADGGLDGVARLTSDAQAHQGARGELFPAAVQWNLSAGAASCDTMPRPWTDTLQQENDDARRSPETAR